MKADKAKLWRGMSQARGRFEGECAEITEQVIGIFYRVHHELGYGFMESVYKEAMRIALAEAGFGIDVELALPVSFRGSLVSIFKADLVVDRKVILELKVDDRISKAHEGQLLHYLRSSTMEAGLVLTFGELATFRRVVMSNDRKWSMERKPINPL